MLSRRTLVALASFTLIVTTACSGGGKKETSSGVATTLATTTTTLPPVLPLTGLPAVDAAVLARPALVVKIDNADGFGSTARPQLGINQADIVYEEMVEGSVTRLAAIFHSQGSDPVGPVRSARTTDVAVFSPLNRPLFAWSGANGAFAEIIRNSPLIDVGYDAAPELYFRRGDFGHVAPHNLYSNTGELFAQAPPDATPPSPLFTYRAASVLPPPTAPPVASAHLVFGEGAGSAPADWIWDAASAKFLRNQRDTPDVDENDVQVAAANVVVMLVSYHDTGFVDVSGSPVPEADLVGSGECWILTNGQLVAGTWTKPAPEAITTFTDAAGAPIGLTPGQTWVELTPIGGATHDP